MERSRTAGDVLCLLKGVALAILVEANGPLSLSASDWTLTDNNASVTLNADGPAGLHAWTIDGQDVLNRQWFLWAIGGSAASPIDALPVVVTPDGLSLRTIYTEAQLRLEITYSLMGGALGTGTADLLQTVNVQNTGASTLDFHFYQYADFALGGAVQLWTGLQGLYNRAEITTPSGLTAQTGLSPGGNQASVNVNWPAINGMIGGLGHNPGPYTGLINTTWAVQWDRQLAPGQTLVISENLNITGVPEPGIGSLLAMTIAAASMRRRSRTAEQPLESVRQRPRV